MDRNETIFVADEAFFFTLSEKQKTCETSPNFATSSNKIDPFLGFTKLAAWIVEIKRGEMMGIFGGSPVNSNGFGPI